MREWFQISDAAEADLEEIWAYISLDAPLSADAYIADLLRIFELLGENPRIGRHRAELKPGLRALPHGNYLIFYYALQQGVRIVRVIHGKRDIPRIIKRENDTFR